MTDRMERWVVLVLVAFLVAVSGEFDNIDRVKRQVTYHGDEHHEAAADEGDQSVRPVTKKPLPTQVMYPGDLSGFFTTESTRNSQNGSLNQTISDAQEKSKNHHKRSIYSRRDSNGNKSGPRSPRRNAKISKNKDTFPLESRLHSSYHKPSVSIMNDVPVEMSFDGAGFLRYEDDESTEQKDTAYSKPRKSPRGRTSKVDGGRNRDLDDFQKVFNLTRERIPDRVKFDDDSAYRYDPNQFKTIQDGTPEKPQEHGTQGAENGSPFSIDFMTAYQNAFQNQFQNVFQNGMVPNGQPGPFSYAPTQQLQSPQQQQAPAFDPFTFTFPNMYSGQQTNVNQNLNHMTSPVTNQDSFMQNHRVQSLANTGTVQSQPVYSSVPQQSYTSNPIYQSNINPQQNHKTQRRKRSIIDSSDSTEDIETSASEPRKGHYRKGPYKGHSQMEDQQDSSSGFIPIAGNFNGGSLELSFPFYGQTPISPSYSSRPMHSVPTYPMSLHTESRHYGGMERYFHPSEARRFSYGVLGSGNFEVIRGGVFPGERQNYHNGYEDSRTPYGGGGDYGNYGTTEIIIDGPIRGFQGFDNFPIHLINALSKNSEISLRPNRRESEVH